MELPKDNFILLSFVNTKLRDEYATLSDFCDGENVEKDYICERLAIIGYVYDDDLNKFI
jgi:hypothetical protein